MLLIHEKALEKLLRQSYLWALSCWQFWWRQMQTTLMKLKLQQEVYEVERSDCFFFFLSLNLRDQIVSFFLISHPGYADPLFL